MTVKEFNDKYSEYLEEGHYGLDINHEKIIDYLDELFQGLIKIPGFRYQQIKIKFGAARFYVNGLDPESAWDIEDKITELYKQK